MATSSLQKYDPVQKTFLIAPQTSKIIRATYTARQPTTAFSLSFLVVSDNRTLLREVNVDVAQLAFQTQTETIAIPSAEFLPSTFTPTALPTLLEVTRPGELMVSAIGTSKSSSVVPFVSTTSITTALTRSPTKLEFTMNIQNPGTSPAFFTAESAPMMYIREVAELPTLTFTIT